MFDQVLPHSLYLVNYLDRILLVPIHTLHSTCHKLNESFVCVRVFQDTGVYGASASQLLELGVSELYHCSQIHI